MAGVFFGKSSICGIICVFKVICYYRKLIIIIYLVTVAHYPICLLSSYTAHLSLSYLINVIALTSLLTLTLYQHNGYGVEYFEFGDMQEVTMQL